MLHRCCRLVALSADGLSVENVERVTPYTPQAPRDPLARGLAAVDNMVLRLACSTACLSQALGAIGEALRRVAGSVALVEYERRGSRERLSVEGLEASLEASDGRLLLRVAGAPSPEDLERCLLGGAGVVAERLRGLLEDGILIGEHGVLDYAGLLAAAYSNPLVERVAAEMEPRTGCVEEVIARLIASSLHPLAAAAYAVRDYVDRSIVAYPLHPDALAPTRLDGLRDYGEGLPAVLARHHREASVLASRLLGESVEVKPVLVDGVKAVEVRVESVRVETPAENPLASLALSIAAALLEKRSLIVAVDAPVARLRGDVLRRELERVNATLLYTRL